MATLIAQEIVQTGLVPLPDAADVAGDDFANDGKVFFEVDNKDAAPMTVTIVTHGTVGGIAIEDVAIVVTNATRRLIGPFDTATYNNATGSVTVTYSSVTSVSVTVLRFVAATTRGSVVTPAT